MKETLTREHLKIVINIVTKIKRLAYFKSKIVSKCDHIIGLSSSISTFKNAEISIDLFIFIRTLEVYLSLTRDYANLFYFQLNFSNFF